MGSKKSFETGGFSLIAVLFLLAILVVLLLATGVFIASSLRGTSSERYANYARESAMFGLQTALGELQTAAGPDQRITAPASILGNSGNNYAGGVTPVAAQASWTGVWKSDTVAIPPATTASYNPSTPDTKSFLGWLVSGTSNNAITGNFTIPGSLSAVATDVSTTPASNGIPSYVTLFNNGLTGSGAYSAQVQKVQIDNVPGGTRYFAFWVEDEGVKADLSWNQTPAASTTSERAQTLRLAAAPGPDYGVLNGTANNGPFNTTSYPITYPLANDGSTPFLTNSIANIQEPLDLLTTLPLVSTVSSWLTQQRQNITWGSRGVLADVKLGGLRRDLSLAFEMDGTTDFPTQPANFNAQTEEFVGKTGGDQLDSPYLAQAATVMPVPERFLYRNTPSVFHTAAAFPGNSHLPSASVVVRGPNWWALRDYANLYKRLSGSGGVYTLPARAYYPNVSSAVAAGLWLYSGGPSCYYQLVAGGGELWDEETIPPSNTTYIFKPARASYAPVLLGATCLLSVLANNYNATTQQANLALGIDPLFYIWNPYNRAVTFQNLGIVLAYNVPGEFTVQINGSTTKTTTGTFGPFNIYQILQLTANNGGAGGSPSYMVQGPVTMIPGEVMIVSTTPVSSGSKSVVYGTAQPGSAGVSNASGVITDYFPATGGPPGGLFTLDMADPNCSVQASYDNNSPGGTSVNQGWFWINTSLPTTGTPTNLAYMQTIGDQLQSLSDITIPFTGPPEYTSFTPLASTPPVLASALLNTKSYFGEVSYLMKPALFGGQDPNPVEVFSRFNPVPLDSLEWWRVCMMNQDFNMIGQMGANSLLTANGINFAGGSSGNSARDMFWGLSYNSTGSQVFPLTDIPSTPLISLAQFSNAGLSYLCEEPYHAVGNSWSDPYLSPTSPYGPSTNDTTGPVEVSDTSWLENDALFDRYYLSGIAPAFTIGNTGYSLATGASVSATLTKFFAGDPTAQANPVLHPYLPAGTTAAQAVTALSAADGYKKMGAYSLVDGSFNVNSTSVTAWAAFLRANRNLAVTYAQAGGTDTNTGTPFPKGTAPLATGTLTQTGWAGFSRLTDAQIWNGQIPGTGLAADIVNQVKLRGPFMSISDFINHRVGPENTLNAQTQQMSYMGALQAAIQIEEAASGVNATAIAASSNTAPVYPANTFFPDPGPVASTQKTTAGIATSTTQADLLLPLAPRLSARSDTFRIRAYGEVRSTQGNRIISEIACEAVVQRVPEYMDPSTNPTSNYPWSENTDPWNATASTLNPNNQMFGRRFKIIEFRWLNPSEL